MLALMRFRYDESGAADADAHLGEALRRLSQCAGFVDGLVARAMDDPNLWLLHLRWESVGAYRRALSSYDIKAAVVPLLSQALDEPSAFEIVVGEGATPLNEARPRGTVGW